ncbi:hypothetical protein EBB56_21555 [Halomonas sp. YLB-10]|nr:hypothetical protein EBB56_21555 [Halomonas sp. YLB-10]
MQGPPWWKSFRTTRVDDIACALPEQDWHLLSAGTGSKGERWYEWALAPLMRLHLKLRKDGLIDLNTWMIDSTAVRATSAASGGGEKGHERTSRLCAGP